MTLKEIYVDGLAELFPPQGHWREVDYFALPDTTRIIELSEGKVIMAPPPSTSHQKAMMNLAFALNALVRERELGQVFFTPLAVRLWEGKIREPDVLFVQHDHADRITETHVNGAPDWVAEIISPGSEHTDSVEKLAEYAQAGIAEYWLVELENQRVIVYRLDGDHYKEGLMYRAGDSIQSEIFTGLEFAVDEILLS